MNRKRKIAAPLLVAWWFATLLAGCSSETLKIFFDGVDTPPPPTTRVRRDLEREVEELKRKLEETEQRLAAAQEAAREGRLAAQASALAIEKAKRWEEAEKILPKDKLGMVDWVEALKSGVIAPRPGIDPRAAEQAVFPLTLELAPKGQEAMKAIFSHEVHTAWLGCKSCHPDPFQMKAGATSITMEKINAGEQCGLCHGKVAFPATACGKCHPAMGG